MPDKPKSNSDRWWYIHKRTKIDKKHPPGGKAVKQQEHRHRQTPTPALGDSFSYWGMPSKVIHSVDFHSVVCLVMCSENPVFSSFPLSRSLWPADSCISFTAGLSAIYQPASAQIPHASGPGAVGLPLCTKKNFWTWKRPLTITQHAAYTHIQLRWILKPYYIVRSCSNNNTVCLYSKNICGII